MEHVRQETTYYTAVEPEQTSAPTVDGKLVVLSRWALVRKWSIRKLKLIDTAVEMRIIRWGQGA